MKWMMQTFGSGTMIVTSGEPGQPHLYIYGPDVNDGKGYDPGTQHNRYQCCRDIETFLNGGPRPRWLDDLTRLREDYAEDVDGTSITAVLLVDRNPPTMDWWTNESDEACDKRARLMDRLFL
jgi:hypothetical protein